MSPARLKPPLELLMWFGLLGAPLAWTLQFLVGFALAEAACNAAGSRWAVPVDGLTLAATVAGALLTVAAGASAIATYRATRDAGSDPPGARVRFLATVGIVISPLFLFIILMSGITVVAFPECRQS